MADGDIKDQMEGWKEEHPEAVATVEAPDKPCFVCQRAAVELKNNPEAAQRRREAMERIRSWAYHEAYNSLSHEDGVTKVVLITDDQCPPCDIASEVLQPLIEKGAIEILPYSKCDPHDKECIAAQGITAVPVLASREADGKIKKFYPLSGPNSAVAIAKGA